MFVNRIREIEALERFWRDQRAHCLPVTGRRRVGKTYLLEHFAAGKRVVYYRCRLQGTPEQLPRLGEALAEQSGDAVLHANPPAAWESIFLLLERLCANDRLLLILDEIPYWAARDDAVPSIWQNWWDERGRHLNLMLVLCGSAVQMMEKLFTGDAPLAGCVTGRVPVSPFDFRAAADMLSFPDPIDTLTAYGMLGGVPLYLSFFSPARTLRENLLTSVASTSARLYVEPSAVFAAHHESYSPDGALRVLRAISQRNHQWSSILTASGFSTATGLAKVMDRLIGDLGLVERLLPVTESRESRTYRTQYRIADNFFLFWFRFIEPNIQHIEFGDAERVVDAILAGMSEYMGAIFERIALEWTRAASGAGCLPIRLARIGAWWTGDHDVDVVGLDERGEVALTGECKWTNAPFGGDQLRSYLDHARALGGVARVRPDCVHTLFCKSSFSEEVGRWAAGNSAILLTPTELLAPFSVA